MAWLGALPPVGIARDSRAQRVAREAQLIVLCNTQLRELDGPEPLEHSEKRAGRVCARRDANRGDEHQDQAGATLTRVD